jgi:hypothetical protein
MTAKEAKVVVYEWVVMEAVKMPGFYGAFYHGSVNWLSDDAVLPETSDIDLIVVVKDAPVSSPGKFSYGNVLLEVSCLPLEEFQSAEQVLGKYWLAGSFKGPSVIADPSGRLVALQQAVAQQYATRYWVGQRCQGARDNAIKFMGQLDEANLLHDQVTNWLFARGVLTHILLVAGLKNPTVRKRYADVKRLLADYQLPDLYEPLLELSGFRGMSRADVQRHLSTLTEAFDAACSVIRTPYRFAADISQAARSVVIDGSQELIDAGLHREAMFWIVATHCRCQHVLYYAAVSNSPTSITEIQDPHRAGFHRLLGELGIASYSDRQKSNERAMRFIPGVWNAAATIIDRNPGIE